MGQAEDIAYAVQVTEVARAPKEILETFGATRIRFHLVSELMDAVGQVRVRTGTIQSERPQIILPSALANQLLEGFGDKAQEYADFLMGHGELVQILQYGLQFSRECEREEVVHDELAEVVPRVVADVESRDASHEVVLIGADELWEISLLKFMFGYVQRSAPGHAQAFQQHRAAEARSAVHMEVEREFAAAQLDRSRVSSLGRLLEKHDLFERYEDRFYGLLR